MTLGNSNEFSDALVSTVIIPVMIMGERFEASVKAFVFHHDFPRGLSG